MESLRVMMLSACAPLWAVSDGLAQVAQSVPPVAGISGDTFTNPLLQNGPDPWVIWWKGFYYYYYSDTSGQNLTLRKTADITDLRNAEMKAVWVPEPGHPWSNDLWAPELHRWGNKWYIYFAADAGDNVSHRIYVVENDNDDPIEGKACQCERRARVHFAWQQDVYSVLSVRLLDGLLHSWRA
jgi:GH43 family beta-xylosidase